MALRKIVEQGDECLTKVCRPVTKFDRRLHILLDDMAETLADANGAGLAAPQVGVLRRVCVVLDEGSEEFIELVNPEIIAQKRKIYKGVSPNVDFYSGFVYDMLGIPVELYTPIFAVARIVGWSAHRLEEIVGNGKIIRPSYKSVMEEL